MTISWHSSLPHTTSVNGSGPDLSQDFNRGDGPTVFTARTSGPYTLIAAAGEDNPEIG